MKRIVMMMLLFSLFGCSTVQIPSYIQEQKPFSQRFYAGFSRVKAAVDQAVNDLGWVVDEELAPQIFEVVKVENDQENILIVTEVRETHLILTTRYARMNIYIRSKGDLSDVELRYMVINDMFFFKPKNYGDEALARRFFARMQEHLGQ